jgi:hypothetical protein
MMFFVVGDPLASRGNLAKVYSAGLNAGQKQGRKLERNSQGKFVSYGF